MKNIAAIPSRSILSRSLTIFCAFLLLVSTSLFSTSSSFSSADEGGGSVDFAVDFDAFAARFVLSNQGEEKVGASELSALGESEDRGRALSELALRKWPTFERKPESVPASEWNAFTARASEFKAQIAKGVYSPTCENSVVAIESEDDFRIDCIVNLATVEKEVVTRLAEMIDALTNDYEWRAARHCELDLFEADFREWTSQFLRASLRFVRSLEDAESNLASTIDLLEFAAPYLRDDADFLQELNDVRALLLSSAQPQNRDESYKDRILEIERVCSEEKLAPKLVDSYVFNGRQMSVFDHGALSKWGGSNPGQVDRVFLLYPRGGAAESRPLYVALHSAGGSAETELSWRKDKDVHNIYKVPDEFYGFFVDCAVHKETDWWWGGRRADQAEIDESCSARATTTPTPVENRVMDEIAWAIDVNRIDVNRVYLCGNSMGGSGTLGLGLRHGDVFAAIKANVPAGIWHAYDRLNLGGARAPEGLPDPPICLDYSAPNDSWSAHHEYLFRGMEARKYSYIAYWGNFGHANLDEVVGQYNDLFNTFDWTSARKDEAYPVFTNATTDDPIPWPKCEPDAPAGQRGAYFRWRVATDEENEFAIDLRLASEEELRSKIFTPPTSAVADVTLRRLQRFHAEPLEEVEWNYGDLCGKVKSDETGLVTIPSLPISDAVMTLKLKK